MIASFQTQLVRGRLAKGWDAPNHLHATLLLRTCDLDLPQFTIYKFTNVPCQVQVQTFSEGSTYLQRRRRGMTPCTRARFAIGFTAAGAVSRLLASGCNH